MSWPLEKERQRKFRLGRENHQRQKWWPKREEKALEMEKKNHFFKLKKINTEMKLSVSKSEGTMRLLFFLNLLMK